MLSEAKKILLVYIGVLKALESQLTISLNQEIYDFLGSNNLEATSIPRISELGELRGGHALVKKISQNGGMRAVRPAYLKWVLGVVLDDAKQSRLEVNGVSAERFEAFSSNDQLPIFDSDADVSF